MLTLVQGTAALTNATDPCYCSTYFLLFNILFIKSDKFIYNSLAMCKITTKLILSCKCNVNYNLSSVKGPFYNILYGFDRSLIYDLIIRLLLISKYYKQARTSYKHQCAASLNIKLVCLCKICQFLGRFTATYALICYNFRILKREASDGCRCLSLYLSLTFFIFTMHSSYKARFFH